MNETIDCHLHTEFSPDGCEKPESVINAAIDAGLTYVALTDHMDLKHPMGEEGVTDLTAYKNALLPLKEKYRAKIYVAVGIECGWLKNAETETAAALATARLEYVINSIHAVGGTDCFYAYHFDGFDKKTAYERYFDAVSQSLDAPYSFHALGHLSYISRNAPYPDNKVRYEDFKEHIDAILDKLIAKDIILELNTNVYNARSLTLPDFDIVKRYKEKGGKFITFSSDAHKIGRIAEHYAEVAAAAKACGFTEWTVVKDGVKAGVRI
jgi:histidinol-phosphatase (PHP family)